MEKGKDQSHTGSQGVKESGLYPECGVAEGFLSRRDLPEFQNVNSGEDMNTKDRPKSSKVQ